jgi:tetratricopeptide (TPR) repeat protein
MNKTITFFKNKYFLIPVILFILIYFQTIFFGSVWEDDSLVDLPRYKNLNLVIKSFFSSEGGVHFSPFYNLQYFFIHLIFGKNAYPFGFHLYLFLAQTFVTLLATVLFYKITENKLLSVLTVLFWIIHPINLQMFTRLLVGAGVMGHAFCLLFIIFYLELIKTLEHKNRNLILGNLFLLFALLTGETFVLFPVLLLLICFCKKGKSIFSKKYLFLLQPFLIVLPIYFILRFIACRDSLFNATSISEDLMSWTETGGLKDILFRMFWFSPQLIIHYFKLYFFPYGLMDSAAEWYKVGDSILDPYSLFSQIVVLFLIIFSIVYFKRNPYVSLGIWWFFISIVLLIQIFPLFSIAAVRYVYFPSIGLTFSIISLISSIENLKIRKVFFFLLVPIFIFLFFRTAYYIPSSKDYYNQFIYRTNEAPVWNKPMYIFTLLKQAGDTSKLPKSITEEYLTQEIKEWLEKYLYVKPGLSTKYGPMQMTYNFNTYRLIFYYLYLQGDFEKLKIAINSALTIKNSWGGYYEVAMFFNKIGDWKLSWDYYKKAIEKNPKFKPSYTINFIDIAIKSGNTVEAEKIIDNYIKLTPESSYGYLFAGYFFNKIKDIEKAKKYFVLGIVKNPDAGFSLPLYKSALDFFVGMKMNNEEEITKNILEGLE